MRKLSLTKLGPKANRFIDSSSANKWFVLYMSMGPWSIINYKEASVWVTQWPKVREIFNLEVDGASPFDRKTTTNLLSRRYVNNGKWIFIFSYFQSAGFFPDKIFFGWRFFLCLDVCVWSRENMIVLREDREMYVSWRRKRKISRHNLSMGRCFQWNIPRQNGWTRRKIPCWTTLAWILML